VELTEEGGRMAQRHKDGAATAVWSVGVDMRLRKRGGGRQGAQARASEGGREGKKRGARR
jgi:hypothetical protein